MKLKITIDSYANIKSQNEEVIDFADIDCTEASWDEMEEEEQFERVRNYWFEQGIPEITFEKIEDNENI